jgi:hypothetical protein
MDQHLMSCATCSAASARVAALVQALRDLIPPVVDRAALERLRTRGLHIQENAFVPGKKSVTFPHHADLLVHRLTGFDLSSAERVSVTIRIESTALLVTDPRAPFDPEDGVLIACQRHFAEFPPDVLIEVTAFDRSGAQRTAVYSIPHLFEP